MVRERQPAGASLGDGRVAAHVSQVTTSEAADAEEAGQAFEVLQSALLDCLPHLSEDKLVDMLEFIAIQHTGSQFQSDNSGQAKAISDFVGRRPFAVSKTGVARCISILDTV